jgi:serine/threonine-protein kinase RIM15
MTEAQGQFLVPPVLAAIKNEEVAARVRMERSASQEIREQRADLKEAAEQSSNVIIDLSSDGIVRWVSPTWKDVVGTSIESIQGQPITKILCDGDSNPFMTAVEALKQDDSRSHIIRFRTRLGPDSLLYESAEPRDQESEAGKEQERIVTLEGQGIMVYERTSGGQSHVSLVLEPGR